MNNEQNLKGGKIVAFPINDKYWLETAEFVKTHLTDNDRLIAPTDFEEKFPSMVNPYSQVPTGNYQWAIIHKGMMGKIDPEVLRRVAKEFVPVFANEVFVIFTNKKGLKEVPPDSPHIKSFWGKMPKTTFKNIVSSIRKQIILIGLKNKYKIQQIPVLHRFAKRVYHKLSASKLLSKYSYQANNTGYSSAEYNTRSLIYLGDHRALTRTVFGQKMFVDTRDFSLAPHILLDGYWEMWITKFFKGVIKEGMTVVEIGANIGYYTLLAASQIGAGGRLYAFEANPAVFDILFQNMDVNGFLDRVTLVNKAVLDKSGKLEFHTLKRHWGSSTFVTFDKEFLKQYRDEIETIEVEAISLDEYFTDKDMKIDVIKMDAEGSEGLIFKGMKRLLTYNPHIKIICEFAPQMIQATGIQPKDFLEEITNYGFKFRIINTDSTAVDISIDELLKIPSCELFLTR